MHDPVCEVHDPRIVGHDDDGAPLTMGQHAEQLHRLEAVLRIERGRRLIGHQDFRIAGKRARDGDALFLHVRGPGRRARPRP